MNILVYGAGAVGGYLGGMLARAGRRVTLITRPDTAAAITHDGLTITASDATFTAPLRAVGHPAAAFADSAAYDLIILAMKSYDVAEAVAQLAAHCPNPAQVMGTQNGIGVEEIVAGCFGAGRTLAGAVTIPISRQGPNRLLVERAGRGLGIAPVAPGRAVDEWVALFREAGINAGARADYRAMKWSKAFLNIMGNATSAILNRPPAELYRRRAIFDLEMSMLRETLAVMRRLDIAVINLPGATARPLARTLAYAPRPLLRLIFSQVIIHGRGDKMPSFHIDLASGKGRSEVVFHNGAIAAAAERAGLAAPVNAALNRVLLGLARGELTPATFDGRPDRLLAVVERFRSGEVDL